MVAMGVAMLKYIATSVQVSQFKRKSRSNKSKIVSKYHLQMVRDAESIRKNEEDSFKIDDPVTLFLSHFHDKLLFL